MKPYIENIKTFENQDITLEGWIYAKRSGKKIHFLQIRDGTGIIQGVVIQGEVPDEVFQKAEKLTQESSVRVTGLIKKDDRSALGFEMSVKNIEVLQLTDNYPISPKEHGPAFLMDNRHLWLRSKKQIANMKVRGEIIKAVRDFFDERGFTLIDAPIFTPSACEGTSNLFETTYFDSKAYLTQSGQLYMEAAAMAFGKAYCFGPTFRAEKSKTRRHLTEFWMVEPEVAFMTLEEDMQLAEDFVCFIVERVLKNRREELKTLERNIEFLEKIKKPFPRITYTEAIEMLKKLGKPVQWGDDLGADEETVLTQQFDRPILVHRFPSASKAFYMKVDPTDPKLSLSMDMLAPEGYGEIIGGGQREESLDILVKKIKEHQLPMEAFEWYLDLRRYGSVPHAGFGLGIERTVAWLCGLHHVRETIPFPRLMDRLSP